MLGHERGRWLFGAVLGFLLGPLGVIAAGLLPRTPRNEAEHRFAVAEELEVVRAEEKEYARKRAAAEKASQ